MEKLTFEQIVKVLDEKLIDDDNSSIQLLDYNDYDEKELGLGKIEEVAENGGPDAGSDYWKVLHFVDHDVYLKYSGYYSSYEPTEWNGDGSVKDNAVEVFPRQKTITVYEEPKTIKV